ncbi:MAG TPA: ABC transporter permease [Bryobacteraceae bacterium]|nr:ABC transporter permease [Bryobacteraceae bacterium]
MSQMLADVRYALRSFLKTPIFSVVVIFSLALGIGANTAIFTLMDQVLLRALPVKNPEQLVQVYARGPHYGSNWGSNSMSYPMYKDFQDRNQVFNGTFGRFATSSSLAHGGGTERVAAELVTGNYFEVLGVQPSAGRLITPEDDRLPGAGTVVVLNHDYWQSRFGGKTDIVGQTVRVNNHPMTVIGVTQPGFHGIDLGYNPQILVPITMKREMTPGFNALDDRRTRWLQVFARLKPGVTPDTARASLQPLYKAMIREEVQHEAFRNATPFTRAQFLSSWMEVLPGAQGRPQFRERFGRPLVILMGIVAFVLLIACANVANLMLARATARQKEIAVRLAVGATRRRIIAQLLTESVLLSLIGGVAGMLLAVWLNTWLLNVMPARESTLPVSALPDLRIFAFTFLVSLVTGVFFGLAPAIQSTRPDVAGTLKDQAGSVTSTSAITIRKGLVVAQVTLSLLLLIGSGLFLGSLHNLKTLDPGFRTSRLVSFAVNPTLSGYDRPKTRQFYKNLEGSLAALPGVQSVGLARNRILDGDRSSSTVTLEGYRARDGEDMEPWVNVISPGFFSTMGIPMLAGREFRPGDERPMLPQAFIDSLDPNRTADRDRFRAAEAQLGGAPKCAIVNERFAKHYFGSPASAVGRRFGFGGNPGTPTDIEIVGVAKDSMYSTLRENIPRQVFTPSVQNSAGGMNVYVRTSLEPDQVFASIRSAVRQMDSALPVYDLRTMDEQINRALVNERMVATLSAVFGIVATLLATIGLYGVMSFTVSRKTREIGIRMALGAGGGHVVWMIMREVLLLVGVGVLFGVPMSMLLTGYIEGQLFGLRANDPLILVTASVALICVALAAGYVPAMRASRVNPVRTLRYE